MSIKCQINAFKTAMIGYYVSHSHRKKKRRFFPNIQKYSFFSEILKFKYKFYAAVRSVKAIKRFSNFDMYIIRVANKKLAQKSVKIKKKILKSIKKYNLDIFKP